MVMVQDLTTTDEFIGVFATPKEAKEFARKYEDGHDDCYIWFKKLDKVSGEWVPKQYKY